jgi:hypothetical protein
MNKLEERYIADLQHRTEGDVMRLKFSFMIADEINGNNRVYPKTVLEKALQEASKKLSKGLSIYGGDKHPKESLEVSDVSHLLTALYLENNLAVAEATILPTHRGKDLMTIINAGGKLGVSARGAGNVTNQFREGKSVAVVNDDYILNSVDFVLSPSFEGAYVGKENVIAEELQNDRYASQPLEEEQHEFTEEEIESLLEYLGDELDGLIKQRYGSDYALEDFEPDGNRLIISQEIKGSDRKKFYLSSYQVKDKAIEIGDDGLEPHDSAEFPPADKTKFRFPFESLAELPYQALVERYRQAQRMANYKGSLVEYKSLLKADSRLMERYEGAKLAGYKGDLAAFIKLEKPN